MGIKQRREREKQEVRQGILTAAREIAQQEGWQAVTIRKVAERIEYSPPTIYEYFASKEAILTELLREGFHLLLLELQAAIAQGDPETRVMRLIDGYWNFAWQHPELYQVMHGLDGVDFECFNSPIEAEQVFMIARDTLEAWAQAVHANIPDLDNCVEIMWGMAHGLVSLTMANHIIDGQQRAKALIQQGLRSLLQAWRT